MNESITIGDPPSNLELGLGELTLSGPKGDQGEQGEKGEKGDQGFSVLTIAQTEEEFNALTPAANELAILYTSDSDAEA